MTDANTVPVLSTQVQAQEHICTAVENFEDSVFELIIFVPLCIHVVVYFYVCAYPMTGRNETLNFESRATLILAGARGRGTRPSRPQALHTRFLRLDKDLRLSGA